MTAIDYLNQMCLVLFIQIGVIFVSGVRMVLGKLNYKDTAVLGINTLILLFFLINISSRIISVGPK